MNAELAALGAIPDEDEEVMLSALGAVPLDIGEDYSRPILSRHPDLGFTERILVKNFAFSTSPRAAQQFLQERGWQAEQMEDGDNLAIRRPGEKEWKVVDEKGFSLADLTDVGTDVVNIAGATLGAIKGAIVGNVPGAIAGGALGGAITESGIQAAGKFFGVSPTLGEAGMAIGGEALAGAAAEAGGQLVSKGAKVAYRAIRGVKAQVPRTAELYDKGFARTKLLAKESNLPENTSTRIAAREAGYPQAVRGVMNKEERRKIKDPFQRVTRGPSQGREVESSQEIAARFFETEMRNQPLADWLFKAKRELVEESLAKYPPRGPGGAFEVEWITKDGARRAGILQRTGPEFASVDDISRIMSQVGEQQARRMAAKIIGPKAYQTPLASLPKETFENQPGVVFGTGTSETALRADFPYYLKTFDRDLGKWDHLNLDTVQTLRIGTDVLDFTKPGLAARIARKGLDIATKVAPKLGRAERMLGSAFSRVGQGANRLGSLPTRALASGLGKLPGSSPGTIDLGANIAGIAGDYFLTGGWATKARIGGYVLDQVGRRMMAGDGTALARMVGNVAVPAPVRALAKAALKSRERGLDSYRATVWVLMQNPEFQRWAMEEEVDSPQPPL
jgi:hypothetical protein